MKDSVVNVSKVDFSWTSLFIFGSYVSDGISLSRTPSVLPF